jgi:hypothetical protein
MGEKEREKAIKQAEELYYIYYTPFVNHDI